MCQVTSDPYSDTRAVALSDQDFATGSLQRESYARQSKLFTASRDLIVRKVGSLNEEALERLVGAIVGLLKAP